MRLLQFGVNIFSESVLYDFGYLSGTDVPLLSIKIDYCKDGQCKESKVIPVTGHGGPYGCETSRLPHFLDSRLTDGGKVVSFTNRGSPVHPRKIPGTHFCSRMTRPQGQSAAGLGHLKQSNDLIGNRTCNPPVCSTVSQPTTLPRAPQIINVLI
jgi:hypothetical protein